jgi:hypothetical protein
MVMAGISEIIAEMTGEDIENIKSMEWTGQYFNPPVRGRQSLARLHMLDRGTDFSVTTFGELVRWELDKKDNCNAQ